MHLNERESGTSQLADCSWSKTGFDISFRDVRMVRLEYQVG